jgi:hypothetical protein
MITKPKAVLIALAAASALPILPADAQQMRIPERAGHQTQKANWYKAPPELQILDERPIVHDFREAPASPGAIQLPPPPMGFGGASGGGSGALGGDDPGGGGSGPFQIPGGGGPGYRNFNPGTSLPLPKADFGHAQTNIPAAGIGPKGILPSGHTTGIHGKVMPFNPNNPMAAGPALARPQQARPYVAPTPVAGYSAPGGGYGPSVGSGSGRGGANAQVSGKLMTNLLNKQR